MLASCGQSPWEKTAESFCLVQKDLLTPLIRSEAYTPGGRSLWRLKINMQTKKGLCSHALDKSLYLAQDFLVEKEIGAVGAIVFCW